MPLQIINVNISNQEHYLNLFYFILYYKEQFFNNQNGKKMRRILRMVTLDLNFLVQGTLQREIDMDCTHVLHDKKTLHKIQIP